MEEYRWQGAAQLARMIRVGKVSSAQVASACLNRIKALNPGLNAFLTVLEGEAMAEAAAADQALRSGRPVGPLHGVPLGIKDNIETAGVRTTAGSRVLEDHVPSQDATVVRRLRGAGAIILGKTVLNEFAIARMVYGDMRNPWDPDRLAGRSSGGSGAAVAAGMCPIALGSDTGGSIRIPASFSGCVGLKPTYGRVSSRGLIPLAWSLDSAGPLTRTAEDAALVFRAIAGYDPADAATSPAPVPSHAAGLRRGVRGLRLGLPEEWFFDLVDPDVDRAVREAVAVLEGQGAGTLAVSLPSAPQSEEIWSGVMWPEAAAYHQDLMQTRGELYDQALLRRLKAAVSTPAADYLRARGRQWALRAEFLQALEKADVLVTPTTPMTAPLLNDKAYQIKGQRVHPNYALAAFTIPFNVTGLPAISVPCGFDRQGLPIGLQIVGRPFEEGVILRAAHAFQRATDWHLRHPLC